MFSAKALKTAKRREMKSIQPYWVLYYDLINKTLSLHVFSLDTEVVTSNTIFTVVAVSNFIEIYNRYTTLDRFKVYSMMIWHMNTYVKYNMNTYCETMATPNLIDDHHLT